eukprot:CAMPEP_0174923226 /NCGR_PEP_ID=MMETSP1355-20121228/6438_1 /TAXON_ID=464990 /ORGANISM="Hemiselmis tepida, Strain CCMP443" /LENGTH=145 /DNA_ID=CAMNT_0016168885 /DNA_START=43 /DNA_END=477 /DNA_ORIENTATION=-
MSGPISSTVALFGDIICNSYVVGASVWYFFLSSPVMMKSLGREKFVPLMMSLMKVFFTSCCVSLTASLALTYIHTKGNVGGLPFLSQLVGLAGALLNKFVIGPNALAAGKASMGERKGKDGEGSLGKFASEGGFGGKGGTKFWHR